MKKSTSMFISTSKRDPYEEYIKRSKNTPAVVQYDLKSKTISDDV